LSRAPFNPAHAIGARLGLATSERATRRFDTGHLQAAFARSIAKVPVPQPTSSTLRAPRLVSDADIHIKVTAVGVECVIDRDQPRVLEDLVTMRSTISR